MKFRLLFLRFFLIAMGAILLAHCGIDQRPEAEPTPALLPTGVPTWVGTTTNTPQRPTQPPALKATVTPTPAPSETPSPTALPIVHCQDVIEAQQPQKSMAAGTIIFDGNCEGQWGYYKLSEAKPELESFLANIAHKQYFYLQMSPDHRWLAFDNTYYGDDGAFLGFWGVTGEDDRAALVYPKSQNWFDLAGWFRDQQIGFPVWRAPDETMAVIDPFTGVQSQVYFPYDWFDEQSNHFLFDYTLERGVYLDDQTGGASNLVLKDLKTKREMWRSPNSIYISIFSLPRWAPDGSQFAFPAWQNHGWQTGQEQFQFWIVDRNGYTTITDQPFYSNSDQWGVMDFEWSPNGRYIVFWQLAADGRNQLMFLDMFTGQLVDFGLGPLYETSVPIFSPDETQFIVNVAIGSADLDQTESAFRVTWLVDIPTGNILQLDLGLRPVAWLSHSTPQTNPTPENGALPRAGPEVQQHCLETQVDGESDFLSPGSVVFFQKHQPYSFSAQAGMQTLPNGKPRALSSDGDISPDKHQLLYLLENDEDNTRYFWLTTVDGRQTRQVVLPSSDWVHAWFDNQRLWIRSDYDYLLWNPFEDTRQPHPETPEHSAQFSGCADSTYCRALDWALPTGEVYDTALERRIVIGTGITPTLRLTTIQGETLWEYPHWLLALSEPRWAPDERQFGIALPIDLFGEHYEWFTVDRNGRQTQLTNFARAYPGAVIDQWHWSPDGRLIAFWMDTRIAPHQTQRDPYRLFVLDTVSRQVTDYCVWGNGQYNQAPVWSPDSRQIVISSNWTGIKKISVIDLARGTVMPLAEGQLVGWMINP